MGRASKPKRLKMAWQNMKSRAKRNGIYLYWRWTDYSVFAAYMGPHPGGPFYLERKDRMYGFTPSNVWWRAGRAGNKRLVV